LLLPFNSIPAWYWIGFFFAAKGWYWTFSPIALCEQFGTSGGIPGSRCRIVLFDIIGLQARFAFGQKKCDVKFVIVFGQISRTRFGWGLAAGNNFADSRALSPV
jgi:hypothetical protein